MFLATRKRRQATRRQLMETSWDGESLLVNHALPTAALKKLGSLFVVFITTLSSQPRLQL
jgi:hypothetical protein